MGDKWEQATDAPVDTTQVRITRYGKSVFIVFAKPRHVKMPAGGEAGGHAGVIVRNIMIDLLPLDGQQASVAYRISRNP